MCNALAASSCSHANKALLNLIKITPEILRQTALAKGIYIYVCVCVPEIESKCSLMLVIKDEN